MLTFTILAEISDIDYWENLLIKSEQLPSGM